MDQQENGLPQLLRVCREQCEFNDNRALGRAILAATDLGDFWVFDAGCNDRDVLYALHEKRAYWLVPHGRQKLRVERTVEEHPVDPAYEAMAAAEVQAHPRAPAPSYLVKVEVAVFENQEDATTPALRERWQKLPVIVMHLRRYDRKQREWVPWVLLTNLPLSADGLRAGPTLSGSCPNSTGGAGASRCSSSSSSNTSAIAT